ncbi:MAG: hypothetical protein KJ043_20240 [Anaerolineae bacterium]|nr:hypothetical protein [Anaerolineae bacterium]
MGIAVVWDDDEKTIIRWDFDEKWTWDDFHEAFRISMEMGEKLTYRVDVIPNATQSPHMPVGALAEFKRLDSQLPDIVKLIVVAGTSAFTRSMIELFGKIYRAQSWRTAPSLDEARRYILHDRQREQDLSA